MLPFTTIYEKGSKWLPKCSEALVVSFKTYGMLKIYQKYFEEYLSRFFFLIIYYTNVIENKINSKIPDKIFGKYQPRVQYLPTKAICNR